MVIDHEFKELKRSNSNQLRVASEDITGKSYPEVFPLLERGVVLPNVISNLLYQLLWLEGVHR